MKNTKISGGGNTSTKVGIPNNKKYTSRFKFTLIMESIAKNNMVEVARKYGVNHSLLSKWKNALLTEGHRIFETSPDKEKASLKGEISKLEQMIGKKEIELNLLKNFSDFYTSQNTP